MCLPRRQDIGLRGIDLWLLVLSIRKRLRPSSFVHVVQVLPALFVHRSLLSRDKKSVTKHPRPLVEDSHGNSIGRFDGEKRRRIDLFLLIHFGHQSDFFVNTSRLVINANYCRCRTNGSALRPQSRIFIMLGYTGGLRNYTVNIN